MAIAKANQNIPILKLIADGFSQGYLTGFFGMFFDKSIFDPEEPWAKAFRLIPIVFTRYHSSLLPKLKNSAPEEQLRQKAAPKIRRT